MAEKPEHGIKLSEYKLPVCDVQKERRNFEGYDEKQHYTLKDMQEGDCSGMTETDHETSGKDDGEYTGINEKSGPVKDWGGRKLSTTEIAYAKDTQVYKRGMR